jgi:hypothetical protein
MSGSGVIGEANPPVPLGEQGRTKPPRPRGRRTLGAVAAVVAAILMVAAGLAIYQAVTPRPAGSPLPTIWSRGRENCPQCGPSTMLLASTSSTLYVLQVGNITLYGNVSYELSAYPWATGHELWPSQSLEIGEGAFARFDQSQGGTAQLVTEGDILTLVTFGTWVLVSGELFEPSGSPATPSVWVLEWNATTGEFLRGQSLGGAPASVFPSIYVAGADGWIAVGVYEATNFTVSTVPIEHNASTYGRWNATVSLGGKNLGLFVSPDLSMSGGLVSLAITGNANLVAVIDGRSGMVVWEGVLPDAYTVPGGADWSDIPSVVGAFTDVVRSGGCFYYIANQTGYTLLDSYNFSRNVTLTLANLTAKAEPIDSQLSLVDNRTLVVTNAGAEHYWAFSITGSPLWNLTLALRQVSTTGVSSIGGLDLPPLLLGGTEALLASVWNWDSSSYTGDDYPVSTFSVPLAVVDWETGQATWMSSYTQSLTLGPEPNYPATYWPLVTQGRFAAFAYYPGNGLGWALSVAEFQGVPP